jgi:hypothetical protein
MELREYILFVCAAQGRHGFVVFCSCILNIVKEKTK